MTRNARALWNWLTIKTYDEVLGHTEKTSTLLVDTKVRKEYEALHVEIAKAKDIFIKALKEQSKSKCRAALKSRNMFWRAV